MWGYLEVCLGGFQRVFGVSFSEFCFFSQPEGLGVFERWWRWSGGFGWVVVVVWWWRGGVVLVLCWCCVGVAAVVWWCVGGVVGVKLRWCACVVVGL